jgi:hypothetical protein
MIHDIEEYRWQQAALAAFYARMPKIEVEIPYDPAVGKRLIGEVTGCVITLAVVLLGLRRRHGIVEVRVRWLPTSQPRTASPEVMGASVVPIRRPSTRATARTRIAPPERKLSTGALAADRLSAIVWNDQVIRHLEKESA